jgi:hypothetical protein
MNESEIINSYIELTIPDDHPVIYQYIMGGIRSKETAVNNILSECSPIFSPPYTEGHVKTVIRRFLNEKLRLYNHTKIKIKPIY